MNASRIRCSKNPAHVVFVGEVRGDEGTARFVVDSAFRFAKAGIVDKAGAMDRGSARDALKIIGRSFRRAALVCRDCGARARVTS